MTHPKLAVKSSGFGGRGYAIPGRTKPSPTTGKPLQDVYPSVTTVLGQVAKPGLHQWIADQTAAFAVTNVGYLMQVSEDVAWRHLRFKWSKEADVQATELRRYYDGVKDDAADLGTNIHEWVEADIDGLAPYPPMLAIETEQMVEAWRGWLIHHRIVSHRQEFTIVNDTLRVAGTADADWTITCLHDGPTCLGQEPDEAVRCLIDLKSSRHTWREHGYQLAALASAEVIMREVVEGHEGAMKIQKTENGKKVTSWWVEDAPIAFDRYAVLHIRPDDLDKDGEKIPRFCRLIDLTPDMDVYRKGFEGALALAHSERELKERAKARGQEETENI